MSAILDIIIIAIIALTIFLAAKRGFIRTLLGSASVIIAIVVSLLLLDPVKELFVNSSIAQDSRESIADTLAGFVSSDSENYDPKLLENNSSFTSMLSVFGIDEQEIQEKWNEWRHENTEKLRAEIEKYISDLVVNAVATFLAFIVLFFGALIILKLATFLLDRFCHLPILKQANTFLGVVLGVIMAIIQVYLFVALVNTLLPFGSQLGWSFFKDLSADDTLLFRWFCDHNLFNIFFG